MLGEEPENLTYSLVQPDNKSSDFVKFDRSLFDFYKKLIKIRHDNPAIKYGDFKMELIEDKRETYAFSRKHLESEVLVVLNNGDTKKKVEIAGLWQDGAKAEDVLNGGTFQVKKQKLQISVEPKWGAILARRGK